MTENNTQHAMDVQSLRADILATNVKLDTHYVEYMDKFNKIESQTTKTNGRVSILEKFMWIAGGGGSVLLLIPTLNAIVSKLSK